MILLILYRSVAAALISLVVSVTAIVISMGALTWLAGVVELNIVVQSIATMLGLGVGVDYSLIVIRRYIDECKPVSTGYRADRHNANRRAHRGRLRNHGSRRVGHPAHHRHAGHPLDVGRRDHRRRVGHPGQHVVLPAVLYLLGHRVQAWPVPWFPRTRERARRRWGKLARVVMARPIAALAISTTALLALAAPALGLQTFNVDASVLPKSSSVRAGYDLVEQQFGQGAIEPILVVIRQTNLRRPSGFRSA